MGKKGQEGIDTGGNTTPIGCNDTKEMISEGKIEEAKQELEILTLKIKHAIIGLDQIVLRTIEAINNVEEEATLNLCLDYLIMLVREME